MIFRNRFHMLSRTTEAQLSRIRFKKVSPPKFRIKLKKETLDTIKKVTQR